MLQAKFFQQQGEDLSLKEITLGVELVEYMQDLLEYGLGKYDVDFYGFDTKDKFQLWMPYRKEQVQQILLI